MRTPKRQLLITGSISHDSITVYQGKLLDHLHALPNDFSVSLLVSELSEQWGGTAANIAYTMALLGEHPLLLGSVGERDRGYIQQLGKLGVDVSAVYYSRVDTARFSVITDLAHNQFATFFPGAMADAASLSIAALGRSDVFVIISPHDPAMMAKQVEECRVLGIPFCFDIGQQVHNVSDSLLTTGLARAHAVIVNAHEREILGRRLGIDDALLPSRVPLFITTYGKDGSVIEGKMVQQPIRIKAPTPEKVVDPTGAGDAYRAGFFSTYVQSWGTTISEDMLRLCGQRGAIAALYAVEQSGGQAHHFSRSEFEARYKRAYSGSIT